VNDWSDDGRSKTEYYSDGLVKAQIDLRGNRTEFRYDALGRQIAVIAADLTPNDVSDNPTTRYTYDKAGQQKTMTDALGHVTSYEHDDFGQMVKMIFHDQSFITQEYDKLGRRIAATDQNGTRTEYRYDNLGQLTGVKDALGQWTEYGYNELGQLVYQEDALDRRTYYEYDRLGRRNAIILPLSQRSTMTYDEVGNITSSTDFNGDTAIYIYDEKNRLRRKSFPVDGTFFEYEYTLTGQVKNITSLRGVRSFIYDERDRLVSRRDNSGPYTEDNVTIQYQYDIAGNRTSVKTASGTTLYSFDERNRLKTTIDSDQNRTKYVYDGMSNLVQTQFANGIVEIREYDVLNRLDFLKNVRQNEITGQKTIITSYDYVLDKAGQRKSMIDQNGRKVEYVYDDLYRLTQEKVSENGNLKNVTDYTFDKVGNRLSKLETVGGIATEITYQYDSNDRLEWEKVNNVLSSSYQYNNNGSTIQKAEGEKISTYRWNQEKRLIGVTTADGKVISYTYDCQGDRQSVTVDGVITRYVVDKNLPYTQVLEEWVNGSLEASYVYGNDLISQERNGIRSTYLVDGLGSTTGLSDDNGNLTDQYVYDAYGQLSKTVGQTQNNYLFAGEQWDKNLEEYYLRQRYYQPETGRFTRQDTYEGSQEEPLSLNKYIYAHNNPVINVDPSGLLVAEQAATMQLISQAATTAYVLHLAQNSSVSSLLGISASQKAELTRRGYAEYIPVVVSDYKNNGCFSAPVPRRGNITNERFERILEGVNIGYEWIQYATQVSGTPWDYLVIDSKANTITFDGLTKGTRNVWESKYGYTGLVDHKINDRSNFQRIAKWKEQSYEQQKVANNCSYNLTWAFSDPQVYEFVAPQIPSRSEWIPFSKDVSKYLNGF
jgi:RHS repeat-associated protein